MVRLLEMEMKEEEPRWMFLEDEIAEVIYEVASFIEDILLKEAFIHLC